MAQLMPLPLTVPCFSKIQIGFTFLVRLTRVVPDKGPLNGCMYVCSMSGARSRYRQLAGTRRRQPSNDICCTRPSSAANETYVAAARSIEHGMLSIDGTDRQTDGHPTVTQTRTLRRLERQ